MCEPCTTRLEHVAAELVDAERMLPRHSGERGAGPHLREAVGHDERADHRDRKMDEKDDRADAEAERRSRQGRAGGGREEQGRPRPSLRPSADAG